MRSSERALQPVEPKQRVDRILSDILGAGTDLRTEKGRAEAIGRLGRLESEAEGTPGIGVEGFEEISPDDKRSAWAAARGLCSELQLKAALNLLEGLKPLPERGEGLDDAQVEDFNDLKRQITGEIKALQQELKGDADAEALAKFFTTLVGAGEPLFEKLRGAGNYVDRNVVNRADERSIVNYLAARGFVAQLCLFPISCGTPAEEPTEAGTKVGKGLASLDGHLHCIGEVSDAIGDELEKHGAGEGCGTGVIPGIEFGPAPEGEPEEPDQNAQTNPGRKRRKQSPQPLSAQDLLSLLRRSRTGSTRWRESIAKDGRDGAANVRSEIERLSDKATQFKPRPKDESNPPRIAYLLEVLIAEYHAATEDLNNLGPRY